MKTWLWRLILVGSLSWFLLAGFLAGFAYGQAPAAAWEGSAPSWHLNMAKLSDEQLLNHPTIVTVFNDMAQRYDGNMNAWMVRGAQQYGRLLLIGTRGYEGCNYTYAFLWSNGDWNYQGREDVCP